MKEKNNRVKIVQARLTQCEYEKVVGQFKKTTCRKLSEYLRKVMLNKPVTTRVRNQSLDDFMTEMIALRNELSAIGNNYNQVVKRLHIMQDSREVKTWLVLNQTAQKILGDKVSEIKSKINQINDQWLQS